MRLVSEKRDTGRSWHGVIESDVIVLVALVEIFIELKN